MKLTIDDVRSVSLNTLMEQPVLYMLLRVVSTSSVNTLIIMTDLYSPVLFNKA